jgi:lysine biosynthesis protein LysW
MITKNTVKAETAECPDCGEKVTMQGSVKIGQRVTCPHCQADLEVVETIPLELDWYYEEETDDDDEDDDWRP